jgi:hypothetical protein
MSSETSTERHESLQPWQLFTLAGLLGATVVVFFSRGQTPAAIILLSCTIFAAAYVGVMALRTVLPLAGTVPDDAPETLGERSRATLEREKALVLRSIKELEFDRAMGKLSPKDFEEMGSRLRARAMMLMKQLDEGGSGYRPLIERELSARLATKSATRRMPGAESHAARLEPDVAEAPEQGRGTTRSGSPVEGPGTTGTTVPVGVRAENGCAACGTVNDPDAAFCKRCGTRLLA